MDAFTDIMFWNFYVFYVSFLSWIRSKEYNTLIIKHKVELWEV